MAAKRNLRQPCHHSRFHAAPPCKYQKMSLLPCVGRTPFQRLETITRFDRQRIGSSCNFENLPANRKFSGVLALVLPF
jgi:hypothetical protein